MTNPAGTRWESALVQMVLTTGQEADRYPKRGQKGEPDVWIGRPGHIKTIPVVVWKRLVGKMADGRRKPDGEPAVVVLSVADFMTILNRLPFGALNFDIQAKATGKLNVTRELALLRAWIKEHRDTT